MARFLFAVVAYAVIAFPSVAAAQTSEAPLGVHPQGSQTHWYDYDCCNMHDCAKIHVTIKNDRYVWQSWRFPQFTVSVPIDPEEAKREGVKVRPSQDGDFHGCELPRQTGASVTSVYALCLYVPGAI